MTEKNEDIERKFALLEKSWEDEDFEYSLSEIEEIEKMKFSECDMKQLCKIKCFVDLRRGNILSVYEKAVIDHQNKKGAKQLPREKIYKKFKKNFHKIYHKKFLPWDEIYKKDRETERRYRRIEFYEYLKSLRENSNLKNCTTSSSIASSTEESFQTVIRSQEVRSNSQYHHMEPDVEDSRSQEDHNNKLFESIYIDKFVYEARDYNDVYSASQNSSYSFFEFNATNGKGPITSTQNTQDRIQFQ